LLHCATQAPSPKVQALRQFQSVTHAGEALHVSDCVLQVPVNAVPSQLLQTVAPPVVPPPVVPPPVVPPPVVPPVVVPPRTRLLQAAAQGPAHTEQLQSAAVLYSTCAGSDALLKQPIWQLRLLQALMQLARSLHSKSLKQLFAWV